MARSGGRSPKNYLRLATSSQLTADSAFRRHWLLWSGEYIRTSGPDEGRKYGWKIVGEDGPELLNFRPGGVMHDRELDRRRLVDFPHWAVNDCESWAL